MYQGKLRIMKFCIRLRKNTNMLLQVLFSEYIGIEKKGKATKMPRTERDHITEQPRT